MVKGGGGSRSRFTENKTVLSHLTKNEDIMKITVYGELNILFLVSRKIILPNHASRLHEEKISHFTFARHDYFLDMFLVNGKESSKK